MERAHGKLGSGLADSLRGNRSYRLAESDDLMLAQIKTVTALANTRNASARERRAHQYASDSGLLNPERVKLGEQVALLEQGSAAGGVRDLCGEKASPNVLAKLYIHTRSTAPRDTDALLCSAIFFGHHHILRDNEEFSRK